MPRLNTRTVLPRLSAAVGLVLAVLAVSAAPAAAATCTFDAGTKTATASIEGGDPELKLKASGTNLTANGVVCAALNGIDTVNVSMAANFNGTATFDLTGGALAPGFTDEGDTSSEIEFNISGLGAFGGIKVAGSNGNDNITVGQETEGQLNLNGAADGPAPDVDVTWNSLQSTVVVDGQLGNDTLSAAGVIATSSPYASSLSLVAGPGSNSLTGGSGNDVLNILTEVMSTGNDNVSGGLGTDKLLISSETPDVQSTYSLDGIANDGVNCPGAACVDNIATDVEWIQGSTAPETLIGNDGTNIIGGGGGDDVLQGLGGPDTLVCAGGKAFGGPFADALVVNAGCNVVSGGAGRDSVTMGFSEAVTVTLDGNANDGPPTALMNVRADIEDVYGTEFADTLTGNGVRNVLWGQGGRDQIFGGGGNDRLEGQNGNDTLSGEAGDDTLRGGPGDDSLDGGDGTDICKQAGGTGVLTSCEQL